MSARNSTIKMWARRRHMPCPQVIFCSPQAWTPVHTSQVCVLLNSYSQTTTFKTICPLNQSKQKFPPSCSTPFPPSSPVWISAVWYRSHQWSLIPFVFPQPIVSFSVGGVFAGCWYQSTDCSVSFTFQQERTESGTVQVGNLRICLSFSQIKHQKMCVVLRRTEPNRLVKTEL